MMRTSGGFSRPFTPVQPLGALFGVGFLIWGVLGFVPGITTGSQALGLLPGQSAALLFGALPVSVLQNVAHLLIGVAGLLAARSTVATRVHLVAGAGLTAALGVLATAVFVPVGSPATDAAAHLLVATVMVGSAMLVRGRPAVRHRRVARTG